MKVIINVLVIVLLAHCVWAQSPFETAPLILYSEEMESQGVAWGDYNHDGWVDLYITRGDEATAATAPNLLFRNSSGTLTYQAMDGLTTVNELHGSASWGDYNNDGYLDLYVAVAAPFSAKVNNLFMNNGNGTFTDKTNAPDAGAISNDPQDSGYAGWGDYNNDGYLDMFVDNGKVVGFPPYVFPQNEINSFYENNNGSFVKLDSAAIGAIVGVSQTYQTFRSGFSWCDFNNDGLPDIFNGSGYGSKNRMWKNINGTHFEQVFDFSEELTSTRGASWGDFDNDGDMDLFTTNIIDGDRGTNFLYENFSTPTLDSVKRRAEGMGEIATDFYYTNSSAWCDFDNDGDLDLFTTSYGNPDSGDVSRYYENSGYPAYSFARVATVADSLNPYDGSSKGWGRAVAAADVDNDGDLDMAISRTGKPLLYLNGTTGNNFLVLTLKGNGTTNTSAIGARVRVVANITGQGGTVSQLREVSGQTGGAAQNDMRVHFGLGDASAADSVVIEWPAGGTKEIYTDVAANQFLTFIEQAPSSLTPGAEKLPGELQLFANYPNPFNPVTTIPFQLNKDENVTINIFDVQGRDIKQLLDKRLVRGYHTLTWDGTDSRHINVPSGIYFLRIKAGKGSALQKMTLIR